MDDKRASLMPIRVQLSRKKGWRMPANTVKVARPGKWGNPYLVQPKGQFYADEAVRLFEGIADGCWSPSLVESYVDSVAAMIYEKRCAWTKRIGCHPLEAMRSELRGKNLACWCPLGAPCHADVLLRMANQ